MRSTQPATTVTYTVSYRYPTCFDPDDGVPGHDMGWSDAAKDIEVTSDRDAQIATLDDQFHSPAWCRSCPPRHSFPYTLTKTVLERTDDGWSRETKIKLDLPRSEQCACGRQYWPIKGESACHALVAIATEGN